MDEFISRQEHNEFAKRMEDEHHRLNHRVTEIEKRCEKNEALTVSVEKLAFSVESMVKEQKAQGERLEELESRDGEMWRKVTGYIITAIIGVVVGFVFRQIGM